MARQTHGSALSLGCTILSQMVCTHELRGASPLSLETHLAGVGWEVGGQVGVGRVEVLVGMEEGSRSPQAGLEGVAVGEREAGDLWDIE